MAAVTRWIGGGASSLGRLLGATGARLRQIAGASWRLAVGGVREPRPAPVPVEVLLAGRQERRALERTLRCAVLQLRSLADVPAPDAVAVVIQQTLPAAQPGQPLAACTEVRQLPDGGRLGLIRLAAEPGGYRLRADDVLAALAEQWLAVTSELAGTTRVLVPLELAALADPGLLPMPLAPAAPRDGRDGTRPPTGPGANGSAPATSRR